MASTSIRYSRPEARRRILPALACAAAIAASVGATAPAQPGATLPAPAGAPQRDVTIYRDAFGVPHSHGTTDAAAAYGYGYAQAEDNFWQIEDNFIRASGRAAEAYGADALLDDWVNGSLRIPELAQDEFAASSPALRAVLEAYAAGVNDWARSAGVGFRVLDEVAPWHPLALVRYLYFQRGFLGAARLRAGEIRTAYERMNAEIASVSSMADHHEWLAAAPADAAWPDRLEGQGSNSWAVRPERTRDGAALLFINPHLPHFGAAQVYEGHLSSDEGWNFTGYGRFGFPMPYVGHNPQLGWASTDNAADLTDVYIERFDDPGQPLAYRYGDEVRNAREWTATHQVRSGDEHRAVTLRFRATHHGPVLAVREGRWLAVRMAKLEAPGWMAQWYAMSKARSLAEFRSAVAPLDMLFGNYLYADRAGNILYVYNAAIPVRDDSFNWRAPVAGDDPATEWQGFHRFDELPQVFNPASGWIQNCNSTPFLSTSVDNPRPENFPSYMVPEGDTARARGARAILANTDDFDFEQWARLSYDTRMTAADDLLPGLFEEWDSSPAGDRQAGGRFARLQEPIALLRSWDRRAALDSIATTVFVSWGEELQGTTSAAATPSLDALISSLDSLEGAWGDWRVPWGESNRAQRPAPGADGAFRDDVWSHPVSGTPGWTGASFTFWSRPREGTRRRYADGGNSYVAVVEFGDRVRAGSLMPFGQSSDPTSAHHLDQVARYANGHYKFVPLYLDDVRRLAVTSYRPR